MSLTVVDLFIIALIVWIPSIVKWYFALKTREREEIKNGTWESNTGKRPALFHVDVVLKDGKLKRNVAPKGLNWDLYVKNPIVKYRKVIIS